MPILDIFKQKKNPKKPKAQKTVKPIKPKMTKPQQTRLKKKVLGKAYKVLIKPLITEKATNLSAQGKYIFRVAYDATKKEIKQAIEEVYKVKPKAIHTIKVLGKKRRYGKTLGRTSPWKKAIVTLKPGDKIEIFEGI